MEEPAHKAEKTHKYTPTATTEPTDVTDSASLSSGSSRNPRWYRRWRLWPVFSKAFSLAWIGITAYLLYINVTDHIVGPSIGCLRKDCHLNLTSSSQVQQLQAYQRSDHNALAGLQLAAKVLDAWFLTIMSALVYGILRHYSHPKPDRSLPIGYIYAHTDVGNVRSLGKLAWDRLPETFDDNKRRNLRGLWHRTRLYVFILFLAFMCLLCNAMGVATALLVLPTLQWVPINTDGPVSYLQGLDLTQPPRGASVFRSCSAAALAAGQYSCSQNLTLAATNSLIAGAVATEDQIWQSNTDAAARNHALELSPVLQEGNTSFAFNVTDGTRWAPLRQTLRNISVALNDYDSTTLGNPLNKESYPDSELYTRSRGARLQIKGPTLGQAGSCNSWFPSLEFATGDNRTVHCFTAQIKAQNKNTTTCFPTRGAWDNNTLASARFVILDMDKILNLSVTIYSSSVSLTIDSSPGAPYSCLSTRSCSQSIDWNAAFAGNVADIDVSNTPQQIIEYTGILSANAAGLSIWCNSYYSYTFGTYVLDPSWINNNLRTVALNVEGAAANSATKIYVHPEWYLLGWGVNLNGNTSIAREGGITIIRAFRNWVTTGSEQYGWNFQYIHRFLSLQALTNVPYNVTDVKPSAESQVSSPPMKLSALVNVWKYDLRSRGSRFAVACIFIGWMCIIAQIIVYKNDMKDATEILASHLERHPPRERQQGYLGEDLEPEFPQLDFDSRSRRIGFYG